MAQDRLCSFSSLDGIPQLVRSICRRDHSRCGDAGREKHEKALRINEIINAYVINQRYRLLVEEMGNQTHRHERDIETSTVYRIDMLHGGLICGSLLSMSAESRLQK